ncbi:MAG: carboxypeptidase-like regulatory domain-containing protein [Flavobacteriales bacterium]|nr:carboxypeptidase-like regulatory domain-containing protein [Flavobacteriales bacterium]
MKRLLLLLSGLAGFAMLWPDEDPALNHLENILSKWRSAYPDERIYVQCDKSMYNPGDAVWFTAFVRNGENLSQQSSSQTLTLKLINASGNSIAEKIFHLKNGIVSGNFDLPKNFPGGNYYLECSTPISEILWDKPAYKKAFNVYTQESPELLITARFKEKMYSPGDEVQLEIEIRTPENEIASGATIDYSILQGEEELLSSRLNANDSGKAVVQFHIPDTISKNNLHSYIRVTHQNKKEGLGRAIPLNINLPHIEFYPESGYLIPNSPTVVAFYAQNENGIPLNVSGTIKDENNQLITYLQTFHHGMGKFHFTPIAGKRYYAFIRNGNRLEKFPLPEIRDRGVVLNLKENNKDFLKFVLHSKEEDALLLTAQSRGKIVYSTRLSAQAQQEVRIPVGDLPMGIVQITVFNSQKTPLAERLCFIHPEKQMRISFEQINEEYGPREKINFKIKAEDSKGNPVSGDVALSVSDEKAWVYNDDRSGNILTELLVECELNGEIEEPEFYLDTKNPESELAMDLLMLTRGYRRFDWKTALKSKIPDKSIIEAEKTIAGTVYNFETNLPEPRAKIKILETGQKFRCDENGKFSIENLDLSSRKTLYVQQKGRTVSYVVHRPDTNLSIYYSENKSSFNSYVSSDNTKSLKGVVMDGETGELLPFVNIVIRKDGKTITGCSSDLDGKFAMNTIPDGFYDVLVAYVGYEKYEIKNIQISQGKCINLNITLNGQIYLEEVVIVNESKKSKKPKRENKKEIAYNSNVTLDEVTIVNYSVPLINADQTNAIEINRKDIIHSAAARKNFASNVVLSYLSDNIDPNQNGVLTIRGAREDATVFYIDGVKIRGEANVPASSIESIVVYTGGIPANYGDVTGGVIDIRTHSYRSMSNSYYSNDNTHRTILQPGEIIYATERKFPEINHHHSEQFETMVDDRTTLYWNGRIQLNEKGEAEVSFYAGDLSGPFRITAEGISSGNEVGRTEKVIMVQPDIKLATPIPSTLTSGDELVLESTIHNNSKKEIKGRLFLTLPLTWKMLMADSSEYSIAPGEKKTISNKVRVNGNNQDFSLAFHFKGNKNYCSERQKITIVPHGFPKTIMLSSETEQEIEFNLDANELRSMDLALTFYPDPAANFAEGVKSMIREPHGCFEQVSSSTYPNILAVNYLQQQNDLKRDEYNIAMNYIKSGYQQLVKYQTSEKGFSLYGQLPTSPYLTAYGIMEFTAMKKVYGGVNEVMLQQAKDWLLLQKDNKGGFHSSSEDHFYHVQSAYIIRALVLSGEFSLVPEIIAQYKYALKKKDAYLSALMIDVLFKAGRKEEADELIQSLSSQQKENGSFSCEKTITYSYGNQKEIESTALMLIALINDVKSNSTSIHRCFQFLMKSKNSFGGWGSTQSTVLALEAINLYYEKFPLKNDPEEVTVSINGKETFKKVLNPGNKESYAFHLPVAALKVGKNHIKVSSKQQFVPWTLNASYFVSSPENHQNALSLSLQWNKKEFQSGEMVRALMKINNSKNEQIHNPLVELSIPACFRYDPQQLRELEKQKIIERYEARGNQLVFYFKAISPNGTLEFPITLTATQKGLFRSPASRVFPYYSTDVFWTQAGEFEIK